MKPELKVLSVLKADNNAKANGFKHGSAHSTAAATYKNASKWSSTFIKLLLSSMKPKNREIVDLKR